jgi:hypothetical protein
MVAILCREVATNSAALTILYEAEIDVILSPREKAVYYDDGLIAAVGDANEDALPRGAIHVDREKTFCEYFRNEGRALS